MICIEGANEMECCVCKERRVCDLGRVTKEGVRGYCKDCEEELYQCERCGRFFDDVDDGWYNVDGEVFHCEDCIDWIMEDGIVVEEDVI